MSAAQTGPAAPPVRLYVVAFSGELAGAEATLQSLAAQGGDLAVTLLASPDQDLRALATRESLDYLPGLPSRVAPDRYWSLVLPALDAEGVADADWLVLRAGVRLPGHALGRWQMMPSGQGPAACFPLSVRHPCTAAFPATAGTPGLPVQAVDDWLNQYAPGRVFDLPVLAGYCALLRAPRPLPAIAPETGDEGLAAALRYAGWSLVASDALYIDDSALPPLALPAQCYTDWRDAVLRRHPLSAARHALAELAGRGEAPPEGFPAAGPVVLHLLHSWGGGLEKWVREFAEADTARHHLFLRPIGDWNGFGQALELSAVHLDSPPLRRWVLARPILSTAQAHEEYRAALDEICTQFGVAMVLLSSLIGHSLDALRTGLPTVWVAHDFYPLCPPLVATFGDPCDSCTAERMNACLASNPEHRFFRHEPFEHWLALKEAFVARVLEERPLAVVPSRSVAERLQRLAPALSGIAFNVVPHGLAAATIKRLAPLREPAPPHRAPGEPLRLVLPGLLQSHKGLALLEAAMPALLERAELLLLGAGAAGKQFSGLSGVTVVESYSTDSFGEVLAAFRPELGLLLSTVPESFSYTLSELWAAGIPVAATGLGAFADRIEHGRQGWLFDPDPRALLSLLDALRQDRAGLERVRARVRAEPPRSAQAMAGDYADLLAARCPGPLPAARPRWLLTAAPTANPVPGVVFDPTLAWGDVARGFLAYTLRKARLSPRLPQLLKWTLHRSRRR